jgi:hypothetical protein
MNGDSFIAFFLYKDSCGRFVIILNFYYCAVFFDVMKDTIKKKN